MALGPHELEVRPLTKARARRAASPCKLGQKNVPAGPENQQGADCSRGGMVQRREEDSVKNQSFGPVSCMREKPKPLW